MAKRWHWLQNKYQSMGLFARLAWGIGLGFLLLHGVFDINRRHDALITEVAGFTISAIDRARLLQHLALSEPELLSKLSTPDFRLSLQDSPRLEQGLGRRWRHGAQVRALVEPYLRSIDVDPTSVSMAFLMHHGQPTLVLSLPYLAEKQESWTPAQQWLVNEVTVGPRPFQRRYNAFMSTTLLGLIILGLVLWATRRITRFLPGFVEAAESLGNLRGTHPMPVTGPKEIRRLSEAFNNMQDTIAQHERERSAMLGAFSHDIRTLVTRISLRVERLPDDEQRTKSEAELAAITQIVEDALAYSKDEASTEPSVAVDLESLLQTLVDDISTAVDGSATLLVADSDQARAFHVQGQPVALRRAFSNLLNNAVLYGQRATVGLSREHNNAQSSAFVVIDILDAGPGIPEADIKRVLEPYVRLESSRNRETGGTGLGLTIASNVVRRHFGTLKFERDEAGFHTRVKLPLLRRCATSP